MWNLNDPKAFHLFNQYCGKDLGSYASDVTDGKSNLELAKQF